jgi:hypothetical protein
VAWGLVVRVVARGPNVAGWDLVAPVEGHFLASTRTVGDAIVETFRQTRHYWLPFPAYSVPFALVPGYLTLAWPWPYWTHVVVPIAFVISLALLGRAAGLRWRDRWVLILGWGASPMLMSYALVGMPWASGILPHAIALVAVMAPATHGPASVLLSLLAIEIAWHCYDVGKLVGVVLVAAAMLRTGVRPWLRAAWLAIGTWSLAETLLIHPTTNVRAFGGERLAVDAGAVWEGVLHLGRALASFDLDLPSLLVLGLVALAVMRRDRLFVGALLLAQLAVVFVLAIPTEGPTSNALRPRRLILLEGYCLLALACAVRDLGTRGRTAIAAALLLANVWQHRVAAEWLRRPHGAIYWPLPYTQSAEGIGLVSPATARYAAQILRDVDEGRHVLLAYNLGCYPENMTNPEGLIERVYLALGHARFVRAISVFGSNSCRYSCLPIRPLEDLPAVLDEVASGSLGPTVVYHPRSCPPPSADFVVEAKSAQETERVLETIRARLRLRRLPDSSGEVDHLLVLPPDA